MGGGVYIVLATHDGEPYLKPQLESLLAQTYEDWTLLAYDDGSNDSSPGILAEFASREGRIECLPGYPASERGPVPSFSYLLQEAYRRGADCVFCCDQDDVWLPEKMATVLPVLEKLGQGGAQPCLVHHDLEVVDVDLNTRSPSFWSMMALKPTAGGEPGRLLSRNEVTGCASACNRALLELALPMPPAAIMHDWWLALYAAYCGTILPMHDKLVKYRQHGQNQIGAKSYRAGLSPLNNWLATWREGMEEFIQTTQQAEAFARHVSERTQLASGQLEAIRRYAAIPSAKRLTRPSAVRDAGAWRKQWLLDTVLFLRLLAMGKNAGS